MYDEIQNHITAIDLTRLAVGLCKNSDELPHATAEVINSYNKISKHLKEGEAQ